MPAAVPRIAPAPNRRATPAYIALITVGYLFGGLATGIAAGTIIGAPGGSGMHLFRNSVAAIVALAVMTAGGIAWARELARRTGASDLRRAAWGGALSFGPVVLVVGLSLTGLEQLLVEQHRTPIPLHIVYGILFVPASFLVAAATVLILGIGLVRRGSNLRRLALSSGVAAGAAYLAVYVAMDLLGWRVGAPEASKRATMLVVSCVAALGAALAGGAAMGRELLRSETSAPREP